MNSSEEYIKTENSDFEKDTKTGALVSTNVSKFLQHKMKLQQTEKLKNQENDLNNIKSEVSDLKLEIGEIKDMLQQLLNG
jgi:hypothetical protein